MMATWWGVLFDCLLACLRSAAQRSAAKRGALAVAAAALLLGRINSTKKEAAGQKYACDKRGASVRACGAGMSGWGERGGGGGRGGEGGAMSGRGVYVRSGLREWGWWMVG